MWMIEGETVLGEVLRRWKFMICSILLRRGKVYDTDAHHSVKGIEEILYNIIDGFESSMMLILDQVQYSNHK